MIHGMQGMEECPLRKTGTVISVEDEMIHVLFERPEACAKCGACAEGRAKCTTITLRAKAEVGDEVDVEIPEGRVAQASILAYTVPLIFFIAGLLASSAVRELLHLTISADLFSVVCGLVGIGLSLLVLRALEPHMKKSGTWQPRVIAVRPKE